MKQAAKNVPQCIIIIIIIIIIIVFISSKNKNTYPKLQLKSNKRYTIKYNSDIK